MPHTAQRTSQARLPDPFTLCKDESSCQSSKKAVHTRACLLCKHSRVVHRLAQLHRSLPRSTVTTHVLQVNQRKLARRRGCMWVYAASSCKRQRCRLLSKAGVSEKNGTARVRKKKSTRVVNRLLSFLLACVCSPLPFSSPRSLAALPPVIADGHQSSSISHIHIYQYKHSVS